MENLLEPDLVSERRVFRDCVWVGSALSAMEHDWEEPWDDIRIHLDLASSLKEYRPDPSIAVDGNDRPRYLFSTTNASGCTNELAFNFNPSSVLDDGSCCLKMNPVLQSRWGFLMILHWVYIRWTQCSGWVRTLLKCS